MESLQSVNVEIRPDSNSWYDTGLIVRDGEELWLYGAGVIDTRNGLTFPEGIYADGLEPVTPDPDDTLPYSGSSGARAAKWCPAGSTVGTKPLSLVVVVRPDGDPAPDMTDNSDAHAVNRAAVVYGAAGRVWAIFNAPYSRARGMTGSFFLTAQRVGDRPADSEDFPYGAQSPIHFVPPTLLAMKQRSEQCLADLLAIKPVNGEWEGWTSWDKTLTAPEYEDGLGNVTPALDYEPNLASRSSQPVALKLDVRSTDVTVFAPKMFDPATETPALFMDRSKIESGYYDGAYWEIAQVDPESDMTERMLIHCGNIGNIQLDDLTATIELSGYESLANRDTGDELHFICQVGARLGEEFGAGRCRNAVLNDGPLRDDWASLATVVEGGYDTLRLSFSATAISSNPIPDLAFFKAHLANGDVVFQSGSNQGIRMMVKSGVSVDALEVTVVLRLSLFSPAAVGDVVRLYAGCERKKTDCIDWDNLPNGRFQDLEPNTDLMRRYRTGA